MLTIGKAIGSGIPSGALGLSARLAGALLADPDADYEDTGGVGGTLAGNALSAAAMRATLEHVLTEAAFAHTIPLAERFAAGVRGGDRRARAAVARDPARLPRRVRLQRAAAARRHERARGRRPRARALPAPARAQPRRDDHAVPQHGADVAGHHGGRRRPPHRGLRRGRRGARGLMRVLALADQRPPLDAALMARKMHVDAVVLLGDLDRAWIESLRMLRGIPRVGVHGNHDPSDLLQEMEVEDLHGRRTSLRRADRGGLRGLREVRARRAAPVHAAPGEQARAQAAGRRRADRALPAGGHQRRPGRPGARRLRRPARLGRPPPPRARPARPRPPEPGTVLERVGDTQVHWVQGAKVLRLD